MAFGKKTEAAAPPPTLNAVLTQHQQLAEDLLRRAAKAGRIEEETRWATMATGHAVLALLTYMQWKDKTIVPGTAEAVARAAASQAPT
jgi:hypothetical protein